MIAPRLGLLAVVPVAGVALLTACGSSVDPTSSPSAPASAPATSDASGRRAVVLVSGLATQTPFTTSAQPCSQGLSAGNSVSALRDELVRAGEQVFSAPAQIGVGQVTSTTGLGASADCPPALPARLTIDTTADIDAGGVRLTRFIDHLHSTYGIDTVDLVGHSMGGLFSRAAIGDLQGGQVSVRSLTTLSTPWTGTFPADYAAGDLPLSACEGQSMCEQVVQDYKQKLADTEGPDGAANVITTSDLQGRKGWNRQQGADVKGIPVTLIAGDHYQVPNGSPAVWPNDAIVATNSALARGIVGERLQVRACLVRPDVHTTGIAEQAGLPWTDAITWDPAVLTAVREAVRAGTDRGDTSQC